MNSASKERQFIPVRFALLTVSDSRGLDQDESGQQLADRINKAGHTVVERQIIPDERQAIASQLRDWAGHETIDAVITSGGTGLTGRDVTVEAHRDIYEKEIDAFASVFAAVSVEIIGPSAIQSRACGGVALGTYFFALPGSPVRAAMPGIGFLPRNLTIAHDLATWSRSCRGSMNISGESETPQWKTLCFPSMNGRIQDDS